MKNTYFYKELSLALLLIIFCALCLAPLQRLWMPNMFSSMILVGLVVIFIIFAIFIWKEQAKDEREEQHRLMTSRLSFLVGSGLLVAGIIIQTLKHELDSWLVITLCGMIITKLIVHFYTQIKN